MEAKRDYCGTTFGVIFTLTFIVTLPTTFLILDSYDIWGFKLAIIPKLLGGTSQSQSQSQPHDHHDHQISPKNTLNFASEISPNLSSCHDSYGRPGLLVNCCPPPDGEARAVPVDFRLPDPSKTPLRVRRPVHLAGPEYWAKYARAVAIMKSLPHSDPRSFSRQAGIHCTFCTGAFNMKNSTWGLNIHRQWMFYPFHRMYLYFHERILGSLIGDPAFALPFWPWDHPDAMRFPEAFLSGPFSDPNRDPTHLAPRLVDLAYNPRAAENLSVGPADNLAFMYNQMVSAAPIPSLFLGCALRPHEPDGFCDGPGTVELAPHNTVHSWVGSAANPGREDMGVFYSAAWDPSFYPHHANVDRLFDVWRDIHHNHVPVQDPTWLNSYFYFYDEEVNLVRIKVSDVLNTTALGYSYEDVELLWLKNRPKPSMSPKIAKHKLRKRLVSSQVVPRAGQTLAGPIRAKVSRPGRERGTLEEEVLVVHGIGIDESVDEMVKFDVYVNLADETRLGASYREFVGTFTRLPQGHKRSSVASSGGVLRLGISEALRDLEADRDKSVWVTLLPMTSSCAGVTIQGIRIEYMS